MIDKRMFQTDKDKNGKRHKIENLSMTTNQPDRVNPFPNGNMIYRLVHSNDLQFKRGKEKYQRQRMSYVRHVVCNFK